MRKGLIISNPSDEQSVPEASDRWLDLKTIATVEISSEDALFPIEDALGSEETSGWRASNKGPQLIRFAFDQSTPIRRIQIRFVERDAERSQEFSIHAAQDGGMMHEVVRQQFTFSPHGATEETEDFSVRLDVVASLELRIDPDRAHDPALSEHFAALQRFRIA